MDRQYPLLAYANNILSEIFLFFNAWYFKAAVNIGVSIFILGSQLKLHPLLYFILNYLHCFR